MNSSTTMSPNTITTANTPRSLTDRCEGNIFSVLKPVCTFYWFPRRFYLRFEDGTNFSLPQTRRAIVLRGSFAGAGPYVWARTRIVIASVWKWVASFDRVMFGHSTYQEIDVFRAGPLLDNQKTTGKYWCSAFLFLHIIMNFNVAI